MTLVGVWPPRQGHNPNVGRNTDNTHDTKPGKDLGIGECYNDQ